MDFFDHYLQIIILGIVEGVTEFLPISSTGHLLIAEHLLKTKQPEVFNVVIQSGAILAVVFIYWRRLTELLGSLDKRESRDYILKILGAFFVTGLIGFVLTHKFHLKLPETLIPVAWATLIGGLVIFLIEGLSKHLYPHEDVSWPEAILIGLAQIAAGIFPGTSRSGATIMTGMAMGMRRSSATEFSFLVGIPTMFAAGALDIVKYRKDLTAGGHQLLLDIGLGFLVSMVVAFFVVKWLLRFVQTHTFNGFAIYRVLLGGGLLLALYTHAIPNIGEDKELERQQLKAEGIPAPAPEVAPPTPATNAAPETPAAPVSITDPNATPSTTDTNAAPLNPLSADPNQPAHSGPVVMPSTNTSPLAPRALPVDPSELNAPAPATNSPANVSTP